MTPDGNLYLIHSLVEIATHTSAGKRVAVAFDIDNTLVDTRGRALAVGRLFDERSGTTWFRDASAVQMGNDAGETAKLLGMSVEDTAKLKKFWFRNFLSGKNFEHDLPIPGTVELALRAAEAGADVHYVTARTRSEEAYTVGELARVGLPVTDPTFVVSKPRLKGSTAAYKAAELERIFAAYDFVPWFLTESRADLRGLQKRKVPVQTVLLETRFSGTGKLDPLTPIWAMDV